MPPDPSWPNRVVAHLLEIDENSCGTLKHVLEYVDASDPPEYAAVSGAGDFALATCYREHLGNQQYTWHLRIRYLGAGACSGLFEFTRDVVADDPTGDYCRIDNGVKDCAAGEASVVNDD
ncbi:MAG: hypothetical protein WD534_03035 [Phycisphaeraceae bacterium]